MTHVIIGLGLKKKKVFLIAILKGIYNPYLKYVSSIFSSSFRLKNLQNEHKFNGFDILLFKA